MEVVEMEGMARRGKKNQEENRRSQIKSSPNVQYKKKSQGRGDQGGGLKTTKGDGGGGKIVGEAKVACLGSVPAVGLVDLATNGQLPAT